MRWVLRIGENELLSFRSILLPAIVDEQKLSPGLEPVHLADPPSELRQADFLGVTPRSEGDYNEVGSIVLTSRPNKPNAFASDFNLVRGLGVRATWSRAIPHPTKSKGGTCRGPRISSRADSKLAPSMARPNLFSGD